MLYEDMVLSATNVLSFHQKTEHVAVAKRNFSAISLRLKTAGKYVVHGKSIPFEAGSICIVPEGVDYERYVLDEEILVIHFHALNVTMHDIQVFRIADPEKYRRLFLKALAIRQENSSAARYRETALLYTIFAELISDIGPHADARGGYIDAAADYMKQHFDDCGLSIDLLAKRANVCPAQFRRKFGEAYGMSPKKYLNELRIQYAKTLLETGYFSHKEIATRCGFSDADYFRTTFKKRVGISAGAYEKEPRL